jgi:hypothetical protein
LEPSLFKSLFEAVDVPHPTIKIILVMWSLEKKHVFLFQDIILAAQICIQYLVSLAIITNNLLMSC